MSSVSPARPGSHSGGGRLLAIVQILFGLFLILICVVISVLEIETTEAFIDHMGSVTSFIAPWIILQQPYQFFMGLMSIRDMEIDLVGWIIECTQLMFVLGFKVAHDSVRGSHEALAHIFLTLAIALTAVNVICNFACGPGGFWARLAFAVAASFATWFFGIVGIGKISTAIKHW
jgi:hypothetical protein